jgi:hypothetical protein
LKEDKTGDKKMKLKMISKLHFAHFYDQKLLQVCPASKETPNCILETKKIMNTFQAENHGM